jgi:hypothetical protein
MRFEFPELESLRLQVRQLQQDQVPSLGYFAHSDGFAHYKGKNKISVSSTATCVASLVATGLWNVGKEKKGLWNVDKAKTKTLLEYLVFKKTSAGLNDNNPFTIAWILEAVTALQPFSEDLGSAAEDRIGEMEGLLQNAVSSGKGGVKIDEYPSSAYLTQLVVRTLKRRSKLTDELRKLVNGWAWSQLEYQLALIEAKSKTADAFAVAYLVMLVSAVSPPSETTPERTQIQRMGLKTFFDCQLGDGTWPLSRPLFHYENYGNAYCYEYEMLTQLLQEQELKDLLLEYLPKLSSAVRGLSNTVYRVEPGLRTWASGHHPQLEGPESWTTASVYHFAHALDRVLAEAVRRELFRYLDTPIPRSVAASSKKEEFATNFLDSTVSVSGVNHSLKDYLWEHFVQPLSIDTKNIAEGHTFNKATPRSAIFFGPPGTSKTELSKEIANFLGWPALPIDPSHLLRNGMEGMQAEAYTVFRMLEETERVVVLFDEFDELVRERGSKNAEPFSRLLTTAMLPKLANIHKRATLVFIIATNSVSEFDLAISRRGRFDRVLQVMPPTYEAKLGRTTWGSGENIDIAEKFKLLGVNVTEKIKKDLADLTFGECDTFAEHLANAADPQAAITALNLVWETCTLRRLVSKGTEMTWEKQCDEEAQLNR